MCQNHHHDVKELSHTGGIVAQILSFGKASAHLFHSQLGSSRFATLQTLRGLLAPIRYETFF